jgi:hypothetical protein
MTLRGLVRNGVVLFEGDTAPPDGTKVEVTPIPSDDEGTSAPAVPPATEPVHRVTAQQRKALLELIGMWKVENPPDDDAVKRIIEEERMKKYG